jgi:phospholipid transport system substrate-binding protein
MTARCLTAALALALLCPWLARAAEAAGAPATPPEAVIRKTVDEAFAVLKDRSLTGVARRPRRIAELRQIADRAFDWSEMARSSLGAGWRELDARQRASFVDVFKDLLAAQYMDDIDRFQGTERVTVDSTSSEGDEDVVHTTLVTASRERVPIDYRMAVRDGRWMVVDLSIEGVSLVNHFRKTFAGALANTKPDDLISRLRKQLPPDLGRSHSK